MERVAIISVDGHVKASRSGYRDYFEQRYLETFDDWVRSEEEAGLPDAGNLNPEIGLEAQWDSGARLAALEGQGVVGEVLFPNGLPFQMRRFEDAGRAADQDLNRQARLAYNRWLADFCAETPGRRAGQALVSFDDIDRAVEDIHWAKDHGLGGMMMPALLPGGRFFFDPALDPVWAACVEVGLPISQHGGSGVPGYDPPGFAALMTLAIEHSFYSGRSLWQMILGGVFERFPDLRMVFVETEVHWIAPAIERLDSRLGMGDDWLAFSRFLQRERGFTRLASEYWATNCYAGVSPFTPLQVPMDVLVGKSGDHERDAGFSIGADRAMFGVDYPHFETIFPGTSHEVAQLVDDPSVTEADARKILYGNAAEVYGFDLGALQPHIDRIGFTFDDVSAANAA
jgi:predicted TIM-barrel fold metal-dependent hydrolase